MKKFIHFLITIVISVLIIVLCFSFTLNEVVVNTLSKEVVSSKISDEVIDQLEDELNDINYEVSDELKESISNSSVITEITEKYLDGIVSAIINDDDVSLPNTQEDILKIINENESILKENGINLNDEQKQTIASKLSQDERVSAVYESAVQSIKSELSSSEVTLINAYDSVTKPMFRWIIATVIIILILILAVSKSTFYRWTYNFAVSLFISAVFLSLLFPFITDSVEASLTTDILGKASSINVNPIINYGYGCFCLCAFMVIIYIVGNKITRRGGSKYD